MLIAGGCANDGITIGSLAFNVNIAISFMYWGTGSAMFLFAGGCAKYDSIFIGAFMFNIKDLPSWEYWDNGSALCWWKCR